MNEQMYLDSLHDTLLHLEFKNTISSKKYTSFIIDIDKYKNVISRKSLFSFLEDLEYPAHFIDDSLLCIEVKKHTKK